MWQAIGGKEDFLGRIYCNCGVIVVSVVLCSKDLLVKEFI